MTSGKTGRHVDIDRGGREILRNENDESSDLCRDFGDHRILLLSQLAFFSFRDIQLLLFLLLLESCRMDLAKFLAEQVRFL